MFGKKRTQSAENIEEKLSKLLARIEITSTPAPVLRLRHVPARATVTGSRIGGAPYVPAGCLRPVDDENRPLALLAQLNFGELPRLEGFPEQGLLQFYISDEDDLCGMNLGALCDQSRFRVVYHERITEDGTPVYLGDPELRYPERLPFQEVMALEPDGDATRESISGGDFRFNSVVMQAYNALFEPPVTGVFDGKRPLDETECELMDALWTALNGGGTKMGGYPAFCQCDPRENPSLARLDTLLFQLDSQNGVMWGDCGVANFFIEREALERRDFSRVMFTWDCC